MSKQRRDRCPYCNKKAVEFKPTDYDWSDYHKGLSDARRKRYLRVLGEIGVYLNHLFNGEYAPYNLRAAIAEGVFAAGVRGDNRSYLPVVLVFGPPIGDGITYEVIQEMTRNICNMMPIGRVAYRIGSIVDLPGCEKPIQRR